MLLFDSDCSHPLVAGQQSLLVYRVLLIEP